MVDNFSAYFSDLMLIAADQRTLTISSTLLIFNLSRRISQLIETVYIKIILRSLGGSERRSILINIFSLFYHRDYLF